jgi:hypothetical protein
MKLFMSGKSGLQKKDDSVSCWYKVHQPRQGQRPTGKVFLVVRLFLFFVSFLYLQIERLHLTISFPQTYVWMSCHLTKPPPKSPLQFGWEKRHGSLLLTCLARTKVGARQPLLKTHTTT